MKFFVRAYKRNEPILQKGYAYTDELAAKRCAENWNKKAPKGQWWSYIKGWSYDQPIWIVHERESNEWGEYSL